MLATSGVLMLGCEACGLHWSCVLAAMGVLILAILVGVVLPLDETATKSAPAPDNDNNSDDDDDDDDDDNETKKKKSDNNNSDKSTAQKSVLSTITSTLHDISKTHGLALFGLVLTYKLGETLNDRMFKPFLIDCGFKSSDIAMWSGVSGMMFSIAGSLLGGTLPRFLPLMESTAAACVMQVIPQLLRYYVSLVASASTTVAKDGSADAEIVASASARGLESTVKTVMWAEAFVGGVVTTLVFALMMQKVSFDRGVKRKEKKILSLVFVFILVVFLKACLFVSTTK